MTPEALLAIQGRVQSPIDLNTLTPEQALYLVLDRALLWAEYQRIMERLKIEREAALLILPALIITVLFAGLKASVLPNMAWWAILVPLPAMLVYVGVSIVRTVSILAREGREARASQILQRAIASTAPAHQPIGDKESVP